MLLYFILIIMWILLKLGWKFKGILFVYLAAWLIKNNAVRLPNITNINTAEVQEEKAETPADLSKSAWKRSLKETMSALKDKDLTTSAAGLSYYATITFFPVLIGVASVSALLVSNESFLNGLDKLETILPDALGSLLETQLSPIVSAGQAGTITAAVISIATLLWTTSGGLQNLIKAINKVYEEDETRNIVKLRLLSVGLSVFLLITAAITVLLLTLQAESLTTLNAPAIVVTIFPYARWVILIILISAVLSVLYRYAPDRADPKWQWVSWGATAATIIWLAASTLFFLYVQKFSSYNETYGTFSGIIVLMLWFNISSLIILVCGQVNKKLEDKTARNI